MTLTDIRKTVAAYLHKSSVNQLIVNQIDLCLVALNQVRMVAELNNDFEFTRKLLTLDVDGVTGGNLLNATEFGTTTPTIATKTVVDVGILDVNGNLRPVEWTTVPDSLNRARQDNPYYVPRYPTDAQASVGLIGQQRFVFSGNKVYLFPKTPNLTVTLGIEAYTLTEDWPDYVDPTTENSLIWTRQGSQYLQWASIVHVNNLLKDFVFRQEGNLPPPQTLADQGLATLQTWSTFKYEQFRRHSR